MAALTICAGLPKAFPQAPRLPVASESQAPTGAGARAPPYSAAAQPKTSTTTPQTATAAAHSRLPRHAGLASNRFRCRAAAPGRAAADRGASGSRTGVVDTIATSSLALRPCPSCHPAAGPPARHEPCGGQIAGTAHRVLLMLRLPYSHPSPARTTLQTYAATLRQNRAFVRRAGAAGDEQGLRAGADLAVEVG